MNSKWHFRISLIKSGLRILGCLSAIYYYDWTKLALGLFLAEFLGIAEEIKDER